MYIIVDNQNYIINATSFETEVSNEIYLSKENEETLLRDFENIPFYQYTDDTLVLDIDKKTEMETARDTAMLLDNLRSTREQECFAVINQIYIVDGVAKSWFDTLTEEQQAEANIWVQAWRDVTETLVAPTKPSWM